VFALSLSYLCIFWIHTVDGQIIQADFHCTKEFLSISMQIDETDVSFSIILLLAFPTHTPSPIPKHTQNAVLSTLSSFHFSRASSASMIMTSARRNKATTSSSPLLSMSTKALVLCLATTSCAAYSSGSGGAGRRVRVSAAEGGPASHYHYQPLRSRRTKCRRRLAPAPTATALHYRDGDADQSLTMQAMNQSAVDEATAAEGDDNSASASHKSSPCVQASTEEFVTSPTGHRNLPIMIMSNHFAKSMIAIRSMMMMTPHQQDTITPALLHDEQQQQMQQQQLVMDEYLEFVQRRYNRLHIITPKQSQQQRHHSKSSSSHQQQTRPKTNLFLSTLMLSNRPLPLLSQPTDQMMVVDELEEDPLEALGLSELASARLRQRLHVHVHPTNTVEFVNYKVLPSPATLNMMRTQDMISTTLAHHSLVIGARQQIKNLLESFHRITCSFLYALLVEGGGLRHTARILSVLSVVLAAFVSRHVFKQSG